MARLEACIPIAAYVPAVDVAAIDELAAMFEVNRSTIIRRAITRGLLKLVETDQDLAERYREARARSQNKKRNSRVYDPGILDSGGLDVADA